MPHEQRNWTQSIERDRETESRSTIELISKRTQDRRRPAAASHTAAAGGGWWSYIAAWGLPYLSVGNRPLCAVPVLYALTCGGVATGRNVFCTCDLYRRPVYMMDQVSVCFRLVIVREKAAQDDWKFGSTSANDAKDDPNECSVGTVKIENNSLTVSRTRYVYFACSTFFALKHYLSPGVVPLARVRKMGLWCANV